MKNNFKIILYHENLSAKGGVEKNLNIYRKIFREQFIDCYVIDNFIDLLKEVRIRKINGLLSSTKLIFFSSYYLSIICRIFLPSENIYYRHSNDINSVKYSLTGKIALVLRKITFKYIRHIFQAKYMVKRFLTTKQKSQFKNKYRIIYPCIKELRNYWDLKSVNHDLRRLIFVGRFAPQKDLKEFGKVALYTLNSGWREPLIIGYGDQEYLNSSISLLEGRVKLINQYTDSIHKYVEYGDVLLLSSLYEGYPNSVVDLNGLGIPSLIRNDLCGAQEFTHFGKTGILYSPEDENSLFTSIKLLINKEKYMQLSSNAFVASETKHSYKNYKNLLLDWINLN